MGQCIYVLLFVVGDVALATIGLFMANRTRAFARRARVAQGRYVASAWSDSHANLDATPRRTAYGVIEFQAPGGQTIQFEARLGTPFEGRKIGRPVVVLYDPQDPQHAVVNSFVEMWGPALIPLATGLLLAVAGTIGGIAIALR